MATLCLPKSPRRRLLRASPAPSQTASFCPAHSSCLQRPMPTVLRPRQGKPLPFPTNPKVETPRREEGLISAHTSSVLIGSCFLVFLFVSCSFFPPMRGNSQISNFPHLCINSVDLQSPTLFISAFSFPCRCVLSHLPCFSVDNQIFFFFDHLSKFPLVLPNSSSSNHPGGVKAIDKAHD